MEQHPVPQNVTSFQFKLIGDITLKQFAYLAGGVILGYLSLKFPLIPGLLRWPTAGFFVLFGIGLAFVPIEERPLDRWLTSFIKSIYSPTQFVWKKDNQPPEVLQGMTPLSAPAATPQVVPPKVLQPVQTPVPPATTPARLTIPSFQVPPAPKLEKRELKIPPQTPTVIKPPPQTPGDRWAIGAPMPQQSTPKAPVPAPQPTVTGKKIVFEEQKPVQKLPQADPKQIQKVREGYEHVTQKLNDQIQSLQKELSEGTIAKERLLELQQVLMQLAAEKERLNRELVEMKQKMVVGEQQSAVRPTVYTTNPQDARTTVKMVTSQAAVKIGIPKLTTVPNVVTGIIKDSKGGLLPNLIVTVKDRDGVPVRALKTNKLGQFAASTPLTNGTYILEIEDPKKAYQFQRVEVSLNNLVLPPLEIYAVSEKDLMRQKLTQEIFGSNGI